MSFSTNLVSHWRDKPSVLEQPSKGRIEPEPLKPLQAKVLSEQIRMLYRNAPALLVALVVIDATPGNSGVDRA
jgi:hypothetical protein